MSTAKRAARHLQKHFSEVTPDEFVGNVQRYCSEEPETDSSVSLTGAENTGEDTNMGQLVLLQPQPAPLRLEAYLACALTGLNYDQRMLMFHLSDIVALVCEEQNIALYEPRRQTDPVYHPDVA